MTLQSASNLTLTIPRTRAERGKRAFRVGAPTIYMQKFYPQIRFQLLKSDLNYSICTCFR